MWFLTADPMVCIPRSLQSFPKERTAGVCSRGITLTNKSNCLTSNVASSLVCTSPLAVITVVGLLDVLMVSNSAELRFLTDHMHTRSWINYNSLSSRTFCWRSREYPFLRGKVECSPVFFFELVYVRPDSKPCFGHIASVVWSLHGTCPQIS